MHEGRTRILVEAALSIALAAVLAQLKIWRMPMGGTVSLEMLPLIVFALRRGLGPGIFAATVYGVANLLLDPYVVHWVQLLLDYPIAHGLVGLAGLFAPAWRRAISTGTARALGTALAPAVLAGATGRLAAAWISGVVFFGQYAPKGQPVWLYSLTYNAGYIGISAVICFVAAAAIMPVLERRLPAS